MPTFDEEIAEIKAPGVDRLQDFHRSFYGASAAEISIVGDFDVAAVKAQLQRLFGAWSAPSRYARVPDPLVTKRAAAMPIETPDKANAFLIGADGIRVERQRSRLPGVDARQLHAGRLDQLAAVESHPPEGGLELRHQQLDACEQLGAQHDDLDLGDFRAGESRAPASRRAGRSRARATRGFQRRRGCRGQARAARSSDASRAARTRHSPRRSNEQSFVGRTFAYSAKLDAALERLDAPAVNAALRKYLKPDCLRQRVRRRFRQGEKTGQPRRLTA